MRDFFKSELKTLKAKTGLNQYENLSAMPDANFQFKILLDSMESACNEFPYIPDNDKKRIIQEQIVRDQDFTGLNSRVIWKWLNAKKDHYWEVYRMKQEPVGPPVDFTELPQKLQDEIESFKMSLLNGSGLKSVPHVSEAEKSKIEREDSDRIKPKSYSKGYRPPTAEEIAEKELHLEYIKQNYDKFGDKKECWLPENEWRELIK